MNKKLPKCYLNVPQATAPTLIGSVIVLATTLPKIIKTVNGIKSAINDTINLINQSGDDDKVSKESSINKVDLERYVLDLMRQHTKEDSDNVVIFPEAVSEVNETVIVETEKGECIEVG